MHYLLKHFNGNKTNIYKIGLIENHIRQYRVNHAVDKLSKIKVQVIGSGSFGDPAALCIKSDLWTYVLIED